MPFNEKYTIFFPAFMCTVGGLSIRKLIIKLLRNILAVFFFALGIISGFIPVLQGWFFHLIGFILLDIKQKYVLEARILRYLRTKKWGRGLYLTWIKAKRKYKVGPK